MADLENTEQTRVLYGAVSATLPGVDSFFRAQPAESEGPTDAWALARSVVDYGCVVLQVASAIRPARPTRDAVLAALLRRLLITAEGGINLLSHGLVEPAHALMRTLLDLELAFQLIHRDESDNFAKRLAAFHYLTYQEHGQDMLSDKSTRDEVLGKHDRVPEVIAISRSYARFLDEAVFDDVRKSLKKDLYWHGFRNVEEAFRAIGAEHDYFMTYDSATWFVHAVNPDHDFVERNDSGLVLKPLVDRDPRNIQPMLGHVVLRTLEMIGVYLDEKDTNVDERTGAKAEIQFEGGEAFAVNSLTALRTLVMRQFDVRRDGFRPG
jgi:hypothetical protein